MRTSTFCFTLLVILGMLASMTVAIGLAHTFQIEPYGDNEGSRGIMWGTILPGGTLQSGDTWKITLANEIGLVPASGLLQFYNVNFEPLTDELLLQFNEGEFSTSTTLVFAQPVGEEMIYYQSVIQFSTASTEYGEFTGSIHYTPIDEATEAFSIQTHWRTSQPAFSTVDHIHVLLPRVPDADTKGDIFHISLTGLTTDDVSSFQFHTSSGSFVLDKDAACTIGNHPVKVSLAEGQTHIAIASFADQGIRLHHGSNLRFKCDALRLISRSRKVKQLVNLMQVHAVIDGNPVAVHTTTTAIDYIDASERDPSLYVVSSQSDGIIFCHLTIEYPATEFYTATDSLKMVLPNTKYAVGRLGDFDHLLHYDAFYKLQSIDNSGNYPSINLKLDPTIVQETKVSFLVAAPLDKESDASHPATYDGDQKEYDIDHEVTPEPEPFAKKVKVKVSRSSNHEKIPFSFEIQQPVESVTSLSVLLPFFDSHFIGDVKTCTLNGKTVTAKAQDYTPDEKGTFQSLFIELPKQRTSATLKFACNGVYLQFPSIRSDYLLTIYAYDEAQNSSLVHRLVQGRDKASIGDYGVYIGISVALAVIVFVGVIAYHKCWKKDEVNHNNDPLTTSLLDETVNN